MQMIWSGALIEHGWSAARSRRVRGDRLSPREGSPSATDCSRLRPPVTDNHHPPSTADARSLARPR